MRPLIARLLCLVILFGSLAWSVDLHAHGFHGHDQASSYQDAGPLSDGAPFDKDPGHGPCSHACHGTAHLLGLTPAALILASPLADRIAAPAGITCRSVTYAPPGRPPKV